MRSVYLMEGENEAVRLAVKDKADETRRQLLETGLSDYLKAGVKIVDAGTGVGVVAEQMAALAETAAATPELILLDASEDRLQVAKQRLEQYRCEKTFLPCDLAHVPLPDNSMDYLFCRFVFEYLSDQRAVFAELKRIMKPGGKMVIADLDNISTSHYPLNPELQYRLDAIVSELQKSGTFDFHAGRKLFSYFHENDLADVRVHAAMHHLFYGEMGENDDFNWSTKLQRLVDLQNKGLLDLDFSVAEFADDFLAFFRSPGRFSYTPVFIVEGKKR
ncbi:MAG: methyltransferase domain-containing protein [Gammaproteobacteria bacterium]|nr:methyltransferase domain-containing protein [Gammaproteobacteria bacterium]